MAFGAWLVLVGGVFEVTAVGVATVSVLRGYRRARTRVSLLRDSLERYKAQVDKGVDHKAAAAEMSAYRKQRGLESDATYDDLWYIKDLITYLISRSAARSAVLTVGFLVLGIGLGTLGSVLNGLGS